jgi:hypothetical protein
LGKPMAGAMKCKCRFFDSPPPNLPRFAGPLVRSGTPFAQNDSGVCLCVKGESDGRCDEMQMRILRLRWPVRRKANADSSTHHPRTYPALRGPWCVQGPRLLRMTAVIGGKGKAVVGEGKGGGERKGKAGVGERIRLWCGIGQGRGGGRREIRRGVGC